MEQKNIAKKRKEKKLSQKLQRKEMLKELKYSNLDIIKLIGIHINLRKKITDQNSLDNLNFEELKKLTMANNEVRNIIDKYGVDVYKREGRKEVIEEWLSKK